MTGMQKPEQCKHKDKWRTKARNNREWIQISNRDKNTLTWQHRH